MSTDSVPVTVTFGQQSEQSHEPQLAKKFPTNAAKVVKGDSIAMRRMKKFNQKNRASLTTINVESANNSTTTGIKLPKTPYIGASKVTRR